MNLVIQVDWLFVFQRKPTIRASEDIAGTSRSIPDAADNPPSNAANIPPKASKKKVLTCSIT